MPYETKSQSSQKHIPSRELSENPDVSFLLFVRLLSLSDLPFTLLGSRSEYIGSTTIVVRGCFQPHGMSIRVSIPNFAAHLQTQIEQMSRIETDQESGIDCEFE